VASATGLALCLYLFRSATLSYPLQALEPIAQPHLVRGAFHVHSLLSDGRRPVREIALAASRSGVDFVVFADHNVTDQRGTRFEQGVLLMASSEISTRAGHVVAVGLSREMTGAERRGDALEAMRSLGAVPIAAHPLNRRRPYEQLDAPLLAGLEVLSADDLFRDALVRPVPGFLLGILAYPVNPTHGLAQILERPSKTLDRWDGLLERRRMTGVCAIDAHGIPDYDVLMRSMGLYLILEGPLSSDAGEAERQLKRALSEGRAYCGLDLFGNAGGFRFTGTASGMEVQMGGQVELASSPGLRVALEYRRPAEGAVIQLFCGQSLVAEGRGPVLEHAPARPCAYRTEVLIASRGAFGERRVRQWVFSNPIYVR
jgi:hypothetical protein